LQSRGSRGSFRLFRFNFRSGNMLKSLITTVAAVAVVELRQDIAAVVRYVAQETRKTVKDRLNATRQ